MISISFFFPLGYRLVIFYSDEEETKSHFVSKLQLYRRPFFPESDVTVYREYLAEHFSQSENSKSVQHMVAATVDYEKYVLPVRI